MRKRLLKRFKLIKKRLYYFLKTRKRTTYITENMLNTTYEIYNGKTYVKKFISPAKIGTRLGEHSFTRTFKHHFKKKRKKKK